MNRFTQSSGGHVGGAYECCCCGKRTRETGLDESRVDMCAYCYESNIAENHYLDGNFDGAQLEAEIARLMAKYKRTDRRAVQSDGLAGHFHRG